MGHRDFVEREGDTDDTELSLLLGVEAQNQPMEDANCQST
jgi:hypothetical protein